MVKKPLTAVPGRVLRQRLHEKQPLPHPRWERRQKLAMGHRLDVLCLVLRHLHAERFESDLNSPGDGIPSTKPLPSHSPVSYPHSPRQPKSNPHTYLEPSYPFWPSSPGAVLLFLTKLYLLWRYHDHILGWFEDLAKWIQVPATLRVWGCSRLGCQRVPTPL